MSKSYLAAALILLAFAACAEPDPADPTGLASNVVASPQVRTSTSAVSSTGTLSLSLPAGTAANDLLIAFVSCSAANQTVNPPTGWTPIANADASAGTTNVRIRAYYRIATASEPPSYAFVESASYDLAGGMFAISGASATAPGIVAATASTSQSAACTSVAPAVTTTVAGSLLLYSCGLGTGTTTFTPPSGMTQAWVAASGGTYKIATEAAYAVQASAGASGGKAATVPTSWAARNVALVIAIAPATVDTTSTCGGLAPPPQSGGRTYYVAPTGSDTSAGTASAPFATIQHAADLVNPGDTVIVADGTYSRSTGPIVNLTRGGNATSWVWFKAQHKWGAKLDALTNNNSEGFKFLDGIGFVRIEGFEVLNLKNLSGGSTSAVDVYDGGHDIQVVGNHFHDIGRQCSSSSIGLDAMFVNQYNVTIDGNVIHDIGRFSPGENGCSVTNTNYQNHDHAIYASDGRSTPTSTSTTMNLVIRNNVFYNLHHGWGVHVYPNATSGISILANTFAFANPYQQGHIILAAPTSNATIANNIFYQPNTAAIRLYTSSYSNVTIASNLTTVSKVTDVAPPAGVTLTNDRTSTDPLLFAPASYDFHLLAPSPAIDTGETLTSVAVDADGCSRPRGAGYDIGAYER
jgi:hypothetical protein